MAHTSRLRVLGACAAVLLVAAAAHAQTDSDSDGLADAVETNTGVFVGPGDTGTDPAVFDSDGDGFRDGFEVTSGTDPTSAASQPPQVLNDTPGGIVSSTFPIDPYKIFGLGGLLQPPADVNGDGYSDLVTGRVAPDFLGYVFHSGPSGIGPRTEAQADTSVVAMPDGLGSDPFYARNPLNVLGDVNGDGSTDVALNEGTHFEVFHGGPGGIPSNGTPDAVNTDVIHPAGVGDVNGDGYDDIVATSLDYLKLHVFHGSAAGLPTLSAANADATVTGVDAGVGLGALQIGYGAGDVNGDGYDDLLAYGEFDGYFIYHGSATGITTGDWSTADSHINFDDGFFDLRTTPTFSAGDVNGDGYDDLAVQTQDTGHLYLYRGSASGLPSGGSEVAWYRIRSVAGYSLSDFAAAAGDLNGDGYDDIVAPFQSERVVRIFLGDPAPPSDRSRYDADVTLFGLEASVARGLGDVNDDGYDDIAVTLVNDPGAVLIYYGGPSSPPPAGVPLEGPSLIVLAAALALSGRFWISRRRSVAL